jgi:hypothetical protein
LRDLTKAEAHLVVAGVRVLEHRESRSPNPEQLAELLGESPSAIRLQLAWLNERGVVALVESAYDTHVEIRDYLQIEDYTEAEGPDITEDLADFDRRKQEEAEKMAHLFDSGEHEQKQRDKLEKMGEDLNDFRRRKPKNPFGD